MNTCDRGHQTRDSVRKLPLGGDGNLYLCYQHYCAEMASRHETQWEDVEGFTAFPEWQDLREQEEQA